jgi:hypothetical protein
MINIADLLITLTFIIFGQNWIVEKMINIADLLIILTFIIFGQNWIVEKMDVLHQRIEA